MRKIIPTLALLLAIINPAIAANIGEGLPHPLQAQNQDDEAQNFESLKGENGAVIVFVRSVSWCPYCQKQLIGLNERTAEFTDKGYNVIAVSYDPTEKQKIFSEKHEIGFTILSDKESEIIKAFDVLNTDMPEDSKHYGIPKPTIYIVNSDGFISNIFAEEGYKDRPSIDDILTTITAE